MLTQAQKKYLNSEKGKATRHRYMEKRKALKTQQKAETNTEELPQE